MLKLRIHTSRSRGINLTPWSLGDKKYIFRAVIFKLILLIVALRIVFRQRLFDFVVEKLSLFQVMVWCRRK